MNKYEVLIEKILQVFVSDKFKDELAEAKNEFFGNTGFNDENSDHFDSRMSQFYDWYFFTRDLNGFGKTPLHSCHLIRELRFTPEEEILVAILKQVKHSVFEFIKIKNEDVYIKDLLTNKKIIVKKSPWIFGFDSDELFEARLIPDKESYQFARGFCFHPEFAKKYILEEIKKYKKNADLDKEAFFLRLCKMRYKYEQYKHVNPSLIYTNENKLGV